MIIHFWELPEKRTYILLKRKFRNKILKILENKNYPFKISDKIKNGKISVHKLKKISKDENISLENIEKNILWIGGNNSRGLTNTKFPINFLSKNAARFIAAIINDGTLTKENSNSYGRLMYDNFDESLRNSVLNDSLIVFGGKSDEIAFRNTEKKKYLEFSSIVRDIVELVLKYKGPKCESNLKIPEFVFKNKDLISGWIEQTIADEGEVKYYPNTYRRAIIWRRSLDVSNLFREKVEKDIPLRKLPERIQKLLQNQECYLISGEEKMLNFLGVKYQKYNLGVYPTVKNKIRTRWQISITKRENLLKLRSLIKIPSNLKDKKFTSFTKEFVRFKEPLKVRDTAIKLGKKQNSFTSFDLKKKMDYKTTNTANKWINLFEKQGLIKKIKESSYGGGNYRSPAKYKIILDK